MHVYLLIITIFLYGAGSQPQTAVIRGPNAEGCAQAAAAYKAELEKREDVRVVVTKCVDQDGSGDKV